jgi:hypothetical protein
MNQDFDIMLMGTLPENNVVKSKLSFNKPLSEPKIFVVAFSKQDSYSGVIKGYFLAWSERIH